MMVVISTPHQIDNAFDKTVIFTGYPKCCIRSKYKIVFNSMANMPVPKSTVEAAAKPKFGDVFDAWNSSSTGHQSAENKLSGSTGWRQSRSMKLSHQFKSGGTGGERISDKVGAGSEDWDEEAKALIPKEVRARAEMSVRDMLVGRSVSSTY
jgi:hypothetical protein